MTPLAHEFSKLIMAVGHYIGKPIVRAHDEGSGLGVFPEETEELRQAMLAAARAMSTMQDYQKGRSK